MRPSRLTLATALLALNCGDGTAEPGLQMAAALEIVSGDVQEGLVGQELPQPLVVRVEDDDGALVCCGAPTDTYWPDRQRTSPWYVHAPPD